MKTVRTIVASVLVTVALVLAVIAVLNGGSEDGAPAGQADSPRAVALSPSELLVEARELGRPVFWVGPRADTEGYELSSTPDGRVYVRYLTGHAEAGDPRAQFLTVGTYPVPEAKQALQTATSGRRGQKLSKHDGYQVLSSSEATNAYVVYDDQPAVQIEIYSPVQGEAADLATSGALEPLD